MQKGKLIVLDGTDGSGKATQTKILVQQLKKTGKKVQTIDFPQYEKNFFGKMLGECLIGKYGNWVEIDPHIASVLYAADRWESSLKIKKWLEDGFCVIADRYVSSNQIHQGGKILKKTQRQEFLAWLDQMEFKILKIPRPDLVLYLDVPLEFSQKLMAQTKNLGKKKYQKGQTDLHENNIQHLLNAKKSALKLVQEKNNWVRIDCVKDHQLLSIEEINSLIWQAVEKII